MSRELTYGTAIESDFPALARLLHEAFAGPLPGSEEWARTHTAANIRVMRAEGAEPDACLVRIPMGQFFGGRSVPMVGIAGVAADPSKRGQGMARRMMEACMRELAGEGVALSALYASTRPLYRQIGYEAAGGRYEYDLPVDKLPRFKDSLEIRRLSQAEHLAAMKRCYDAFAGAHNGTLDRGTYCWNRVWKFREEPYKGFGAFGASGELEGYVLLAQQRGIAFGKHDLVLSDCAFSTPAGARSILTFLAGYTTMGDRLKFYAGPTHPFFTMLPHQWGGVRLYEPWMLRITDVKSALEGRGYDPAVRAQVCFDIADDTVPGNRGHWCLRVEGGRGAVSQTSSGDVLTTSIRGLAAMYSGYLTPRDAMFAGLCSGPAPALASAQPAFAGPSAWMIDFF